MKYQEVSFLHSGKNLSDNTKTARAALVNTTANIIMTIVAMLMIPITTRILHTGDLGNAVSFFSIRNICLNIFTLASYTAVNRGLLEFHDNKFEFLSSLLLFNLVTIGLFGLVYGIFRSFFESILGFTPLLSFLLFFSVLLWMSYTIGTTYLLYHNRYKTMFCITMCIGPFSQFLAIFLILHLNSDKYLGRIIGLDGFYWIIGFLFLILILLKGHFTFKKIYIKYALSLSLPLIPHLLAQTLLSQSDIIMITNICNSDKSGIYSMAYTIAMVLYALLSQIMAVWSPWCYRRLNEKNTSVIYQYSKVLYFVALIMSIGLMMISPEAVSLFLADSYHECMYLIPIIIVGMFFLFSYTFFYDIEYYHKKTILIAVASILAASINIVLNLIFIPVLGYIAAGYTTAIGYFLLMLLHMIFMKKIDNRKIYNIPMLFIASLFVLIFALLMVYLIDYIFLRYLIGILSILILLFFIRKDIFSFLKVFLS